MVSSGDISENELKVFVALGLLRCVCIEVNGSSRQRGNRWHRVISIVAGGKTLNAIPIIFGIGVVTSVFGLTLVFYLIFSLRVLELVPSSEKSWPWPKPAPNWKRPSGGRIFRARPP
jgi:hypothetical protein